MKIKSNCPVNIAKGKNQYKSNKGLTVMELLIVIAIVGILGSSIGVFASQALGNYQYSMAVTDSYTRLSSLMHDIFYGSPSSQVRGVISASSIEEVSSDSEESILSYEVGNDLYTLHWAKSTEILLYNGEILLRDVKSFYVEDIPGEGSTTIAIVIEYSPERVRGRVFRIERRVKIRN